MQNNSGVFRYTLRSVRFQPAFILWTFIAMAASAVIFLSEISHVRSGGIILTIKGMSFPVAGNGAIWLGYFFWIALLLSILTFSRLIAEMTDKKRMILILSKPVSRKGVVYQSAAAVFFCMLIYSAVSGVLIGLSLPGAAGIFSTGFLMTFLLLIPLSLLFVYIISYLAVLIFNSGSVPVIMLLIYCMILSPALAQREHILSMLSADSKLLESLLDTIYYITPRISDLALAARDLCCMGKFDIQFAGGIILSIIPSLILLLHKADKKEY